MATWAEMRELSTRLVALEQDLHKAGLPATAMKVNTAVQKIGWEFAAQPDHLKDARTKGERKK